MFNLVMLCSIFGLATPVKRVLVLVEQGQATALASSLTAWENDIKLEGFNSTRLVVNNLWTAPQIKTRIKTWYNLAPSARNHLFIVGSIPTVKVWTYGPDGHGWQGFTPTDSWYTDMSNSWKNKTYNGISGYTSNFPIGQFAGIGRVDYRPLLPTGTIYTPSFQKDKLISYFAKNHRYRTGGITYTDDFVVFYSTAWQWVATVYAGPIVLPIGWKVRQVVESYTPVKEEQKYTLKYKFSVFTPGGSSWPEQRFAVPTRVRYISFCWTPYVHNPGDINSKSTPYHLRLLNQDPLCIGVKWGFPSSTNSLKQYLNREITLGELTMQNQGHPVICVVCGDPTLSMVK